MTAHRDSNRKPSDYTDTVIELTLNDARALRPLAEAVMAAVEPDTRHELDKINELLQDVGINYPLGARGVADLIGSYRGLQEELDELRRANS